MSEGEGRRRSALPALSKTFAGSIERTWRVSGVPAAGGRALILGWRGPVNRVFEAAIGIDAAGNMLQACHRFLLEHQLLGRRQLLQVKSPS